MARIELNEIAHSYLKKPKDESDYALKRIHNEWDDGGAYALLGPSGCGKTTLLNVISGLLTPSKGRVLYDGRDVTDLPPEKRNMARIQGLAMAMIMRLLLLLSLAWMMRLTNPLFTIFDHEITC